MTDSSRPARVASWLAALGIAAAVAACGSTTKEEPKAASATTASADAAVAESAGPEGRPDITEFCGTKPLKVALVDGFGGNGWRKILRAEYEAEAAKCPNIEEAAYQDAGGDPQKYIAAIDGLTAKGTDVIIGFNDFGSATLAALKRAHRKGVVVVPYNADPGGKIGEDYTDFISVDYNALVAEWIDWLDRALDGKGKLMYVGGPAGNPQDSKWLEVVKQELTEHPGLHLVTDTFLETKFDSASVQQAVSGALSKYDHIDGYMSSYGTAMTGLIRAYENAGKPLVPMATVASANELGCLWKAASPHFDLLSLDVTPQLARIALRKAVAAANGIEDPEPAGYQVQPFMDTLAGKEPPCEKSLPPDADLSSSLTQDELAALFGA